MQKIIPASHWDRDMQFRLTGPFSQSLSVRLILKNMSPDASSFSPYSSIFTLLHVHDSYFDHRIHHGAKSLSFAAVVHGIDTVLVAHPGDEPVCTRYSHLALPNLKCVIAMATEEQRNVNARAFECAATRSGWSVCGNPTSLCCTCQLDFICTRHVIVAGPESLSS